MAVKYDLQGVIKYHRKQAGLSRKELAALAGVGKTVIYDLEKGKQTTRWSTITAILAVLNVSIEFKSPLMQDYETSRDQDS